MAVPFVLPEDDDSNEILLEIYECLTVLMQELQIRRSREPSSQISTRVRNSMVPRRRLRDESGVIRVPFTLISESIISTGPFISNTDSQDSSCFEEDTLKSFSSNALLELESEIDCSQDCHVTKRQSKTSSGSGADLVSKFVPTSWTSRTIWTAAVVCVVGWHLLGTR